MTEHTECLMCWKAEVSSRASVVLFGLNVFGRAAVDVWKQTRSTDPNSALLDNTHASIRHAASSVVQWVLAGKNGI